MITVPIISKNNNIYPPHFQGADLPCKTPRANAAYIFRQLIGGYCITHPHLDHVSGLIMNTAGIMPKDAKKVIAGLSTTIDALKTHIFNDIIWPNLSDENGGVGFVTYKRLVDASVIGGKIEYKKIIDGLSVQVWPVSHGHCMKAHKHRATDVEEPPTPGISASRHQGHAYVTNGDVPAWKRKCVYDSSCFFIRDDATMKELLIFGDIEPDSVSISIPRRNLPVWIYAAEKIHRGVLSTIFIECSYDIHQPDPFLYGHLTPRHVVEELTVLASKVMYYREMAVPRRPKRRRTTVANTHQDGILMSYNPFHSRAASPAPSGYASGDEAYDSETPRSPRDMEGVRYHTGTKRRRTEDMTGANLLPALPPGIGDLDDTPLKGLKVVIMHIKDDFDDDRDVRQSILANLRKLDAQAGLGVQYELAENGGSMYF